MSARVELKRTQLYTIHSEINFEKYDLYVRLPNSYDKRTAEDKYDALYILNGQWDFGLMLSVYGSLAFDGLLPDMILIGIAWHGQETDDEARECGQRDFNATIGANGEPRGGAVKFSNILENEIIPYVENNFQTSNTRTLSGSSIAAFFGFFALFHKPALFNKYVLSSPPTWTSNGLLFHLESLFSQAANNDVNAKIYVTYGSLEETLPIKKFLDVLISRNYKNLSIVHEEIENTGHAGNKPIGYTKGLIHVYKKE